VAAGKIVSRQNQLALEIFFGPGTPEKYFVPGIGIFFDLRGRADCPDPRFMTFWPALS